MTATSDGCATGTKPEVRQPPFLIADASKWQGDNPNWATLEPHLVGIVLKATQGVNYAPDWFVKHWPAVKAVGGDRYGETWFRGAYHFLDFRYDGKKQAEAFLRHVQKAGGFDVGDFCPVVDVERGGGNQGATRQQVVDATTAFAQTIDTEIGRSCILYGRGAMRDLGIVSKMGCACVWNPSYTQTMVMKGLQPVWTLDDVVLWQYTDGSSGDNSIHGCPLRLDGWNNGLDLSVVVNGAKPVTLERVKKGLVRR